MSHPEISRRCLACGATVRANARFCPQCGRRVVKEPLNRAGAFSKESPRAAPDAETERGAKPATTSQVEDEAQASGGAPRRVTGPLGRKAGDTGELKAPAAEDAPAVAPPPAKRRRTTVIVEENLRPRVEKLREASMVVLEEASEDSGARFVLIALAVFLLFLLFLLISNVLR